MTTIYLVYIKESEDGIFLDYITNNPTKLIAFRNYEDAKKIVLKYTSSPYHRTHIEEIEFVESSD